MPRRTERGWAGHFWSAEKCLFRRNTLLELGDVKVVVSSVGMMYDFGLQCYSKIGLSSYYETMVFHAMLIHGVYWDADLERKISLRGGNRISSPYQDMLANDMHENAITEISRRMLEGTIEA